MKFWNWVKNEEGRTLYFDGYIAQKAVELGFADKVLYEPDQDESSEGFIFDKVTVTNALLRKLPKAKQTQSVAETGTPHEQLLKRLDLIK